MLQRQVNHLQYADYIGQIKIGQIEAWPDGVKYELISGEINFDELYHQTNIKIDSEESL